MLQSRNEASVNPKLRTDIKMKWLALISVILMALVDDALACHGGRGNYGYKKGNDYYKDKKVYDHGYDGYGGGYGYDDHGHGGGYGGYGYGGYH